MPYLLHLEIDVLFPAHRYRELSTILVAGLLLQSALMVYKGFQSYASQKLATKLQCSLTRSLFHCVHHLPISFFEEQTPGEIGAGFSSLRASLGSFLSILSAISGCYLYLLGAPAAMLIMSWRLALPTLVVTPIMTVFLVRRSRKLYKSSARIVEATSRLVGLQVETFDAAASMRFLSFRRALIHRQQIDGEAIKEQQAWAARSSLKYSMILDALKALGWTVTIGVGWYLVVAHQLLLGQLLAFMAYMNLFYNPLADIIAPLANIHEPLAAIGRALALLRRPSEVQWWAQQPSSGAGDSMLNARPLLEVSNLSFTYSRNHSPIIEHLNLVLEASEIAVVRGQSGCGKTTLLKLLSGFVKPTAGSILLDGHEINTLSLDRLRAEMATIYQHTAFISGTLREVLTSGSLVSDDKLRSVLSLCTLGAFYKSLPNGLDTLIGARGISVSAGERQRLALAQLACAERRLVLLDEPTSNLDEPTETALLENLRKLFPSSAIIMVSHRAKPLEGADYVVEKQVAGAWLQKAVTRSPSRRRQSSSETSHEWLLTW